MSSALEAQHAATDPGAIGDEIHALMRRLYPIPRSITGDGLRRSLAIMREYVPLELYEVPSGTTAFDWTVPKENKCLGDQNDHA